MRRWILALIPLLGGAACDKPIHEASAASAPAPIAAQVASHVQT